MLKILSYIKIRCLIKHARFLKEKGFHLVFLRNRIIKYKLAFVSGIKITLDWLYNLPKKKMEIHDIKWYRNINVGKLLYSNLVWFSSMAPKWKQLLCWSCSNNIWPSKVLNKTLGRFPVGSMWIQNLHKCKN